MFAGLLYEYRLSMNNKKLIYVNYIERFVDRIDWN